MAWPTFPNLRAKFESQGLGAAFRWLTQDLPNLWKQIFNSDNSIKATGDITFLENGKGPILKNITGTKTKRVRLNDAGDGFIFDEV